MCYTHHVQAACGQEHSNQNRRQAQPTVYHRFSQPGSYASCLVAYFTNTVIHYTLVYTAVEKKRDICAENKDRDDGKDGSASKKEGFVTECIGYVCQTELTFRLLDAGTFSGLFPGVAHMWFKTYIFY
jgi:hypothetical protein